MGISDNNERQRLPEWLRKNGHASHSTHEIKKGLRARGLHTVCEEAHCPNMGECFERGTATIMIMGDTCTRACGFCAVKTGVPTPLDHSEPERVAAQVKALGLKHAVITSVTRDDLADGGAFHFAVTIAAVKAMCPGTSIEVLTPDFMGREGDVSTVCKARPDIFNHNIETVERLTPSVRDKRASYRRSLEVLSLARKELPQGRVKSGLMVGLGETDREVESALLDLAKAGCDIVTIGQYLRPAKGKLKVAVYITPEIFQRYEKIGLKQGIKYMFCGPFVRSSYMADKALL